MMLYTNTKILLTKKIIIMIKQEYLSLEFVYKFANNLYKRNGFIMDNFSFGIVKFKGKQPRLLENNQGYNICYSFSGYKVKADLPEKIKEYYSTDSMGLYSDDKSVPYSIIKQGLEIKSFYFDIFNEVLYEKQANDDVTVVDYPPYFFYNGQYYYAICHQPSIMQEYHSRAFMEFERLCNGHGSYNDYCKEMGITKYNCFPLYELLQKCYDYHDGWINEGKDWDNDWDTIFEVDDLNELKRLLYGAIKLDFLPKRFLGIHQKNRPLFYTSNCLELTIPIVESVRALAQEVKHLAYEHNELYRFVYDAMHSIALQGYRELEEEYRHLNLSILENVRLENALFDTRIIGNVDNPFMWIHERPARIENEYFGRRRYLEYLAAHGNDSVDIDVNKIMRYCDNYEKLYALKQEFDTKEVLTFEQISELNRLLLEAK